ncbi:ATP-binding SpoIIE family protein phosphatase [Sporichthya polymorpha]|uniref:ATP-binding SpoIIE family protein phosphatase n=1 Tax=Sporichthya polymorpha TaxID=35751 RepID=UPI00036D6389|nr:ATP-binding SpoIIE family protein phosphatase [Sporichthya polymorpha]
MSVRAHRRLRLPADDRTPAVARAAVRQVLLAGGWADQLDEALLLVSELSTNGIVHAGTPVDVDVLADDTGVTITVSDQKSGLVGATTAVRSGPFDLIAAGGPNGDGDLAPTGNGNGRARAGAAEAVWDDTVELEERGRGLMLVDRLASAWGTSHHATGKSVWFRLGTDTVPDTGPPVVPVETVEAASGTAATDAALPSALEAIAAPAPNAAPAADGTAVPPAAWVWLDHVPEALRSRLTMPQLVSELLERLCDVTGAATGSVWLDRGDTAGERRLAGYSSPHGPRPAPGDEADTVVVPLPVAHPLRGKVVLHPPAGRRPGRYWQELAALSAQRMAIGIDAERLQGDEMRRRGWVTFLAEASELLANSLDLELTTALAAQLVVPRLGSWAVVHLVDPRGELRTVAVAHADEHAIPRIRAHAEAAETRTRLAAVLDQAATVPFDGDLAGLALPLVARGRVIGVLSVGRFADRVHSGDDAAALADFARRASLAIDNATAHAERIRVADELQRALLPRPLPEAPGIEFGAVYVPAGTGDVGGDFYDVFGVRRNRWFVSMGDICGKGSQAAVMTGAVREVMRALIGEDRATANMLATLNRTLLASANDRYATVAAAMVTRLEPPGRPRTLDVALCLAGHDRPVLLEADGAVRSVGECGSAVGLVEQFETPEVNLTLRQGDALVFVTDGVTERRRQGSMYGTQRLRDLLGTMAGRPAQEIADRVQQDVLAFAPEPPRDDIAVLVLRNPL